VSEVTFKRSRRGGAPMAPKKVAKKAAKSPKKAAKKPAKKAASKPQGGAAQEIAQRFRELGDWRGDTMTKMRALILAADPEMVEEVKWRKPSNPDGVPVWSHDGMVCTGEVYKDHVKLTFANGAALKDPARLFNASMDAGTRRAIDLHQGESVDEKAFRELVREAVTMNVVKRGK